MSLFRILGPVAVGPDPERNEPFASARVRALLTALLLHANGAVSLGRLADYLWLVPPPSAGPNLRNHASALRAALEAASPGLSARLHTRRGGGGAYWLTVRDDELDSHRFIRLAERGERELRAGDHCAAEATLREALRLWRGGAGADVPDTLPLRQRFDDLDQRRLHVRVDLCAARLALGESRGIVHELHALVAALPLSERPVELLIRTLAATGERAAAVAQYHRFRERLGAETGVEPSSQLLGLFLRILRNETEPVTERAG